MTLPTMPSVLPLPPGPRLWPLVGAPATLSRAKNFLAVMEWQWQTYGDVSRTEILGRSMTMIAHPDHLAKVLMTDRDNYPKGAVYDGARRFMGDSLVTLDGDTWKGRRKLANPAFHTKALRGLTHEMIRSGARFFDALGRRAPRGQVIEAHQVMTHLTLDVVVDALFGHDTIDTTTDVSFDALRSALELISGGFNSVPIPAWVPTPRNRRFVRTLAELDRTIYRIIESGRRAAGSTTNLLSMLLDARDENDQPLPVKAVRDDVFTMFLAGHETTALTMTWLLVMLDGRPDILARMQAEVDEVLGGRLDPEPEDLARMIYVRQVIDETLRIRPPAPAVGRDVLRDDEIGGFRVSRGEQVTPMIWVTHRHPEFWPDPERFDPERFTPEAVRDRNPWSYLPFSRGPRVCIGAAFSLNETVILVAQLLRRFRITVLPCDDVHPVAVGTIRPSAPVRVKLEPRA